MDVSNTHLRFRPYIKEQPSAREVNDVIAAARSFVGAREETQSFLTWAWEVGHVHNLLNAKCTVTVCAKLWRFTRSAVLDVL